MSQQSQEQTFPGNHTFEEWRALSPAERHAAQRTDEAAAREIRIEALRAKQAEINEANRVRESEAKQQREAAEAERQAKSRQIAKAAYLAAAPGATEAEFDTFYDEQLREQRKTAVVQQQQRMRSGMRRRLSRAL